MKLSIRGRNIGILLIEVGLAFALAYAAIQGFVNPSSWIGFFPPQFQALAPAGVLLGIFGIIEIILALWLIFGRRRFFPALATAILLTGITLFNWPLLDIVFRDAALALVAYGLAFTHYS